MARPTASPRLADVPPTDLLARTRATYDGALVPGEGLRRSEIDADVEVFDARKARVAVDRPSRPLTGHCRRCCVS